MAVLSESATFLVSLLLALLSFSSLQVLKPTLASTQAMTVVGGGVASLVFSTSFSLVTRHNGLKSCGKDEMGVVKGPLLLPYDCRSLFKKYGWRALNIDYSRIQFYA